LAEKDETVFVIGGGEIYKQAMPFADRLEITEVDLHPQGDSWFPEIVMVDWEISSKITPPQPSGTGFSFLTYRTQSTK
jgi:dihydrofolate reductase